MQKATESLAKGAKEEEEEAAAAAAIFKAV